MTSSCLCKKSEGAVFPLLVEAMEDGVGDTLDAELVDEADHGPRSAANFHEAAFDDVGGAQFAPQVLRHLKEAKQVGQILFEFAHQGGISFLPVRLEGAKRSDGPQDSGHDKGWHLTQRVPKNPHQETTGKLLIP